MMLVKQAENHQRQHGKAGRDNQLETPKYLLLPERINQKHQRECHAVAFTVEPAGHEQEGHDEQDSRAAKNRARTPDKPAELMIESIERSAMILDVVIVSASLACAAVRRAYSRKTSGVRGQQRAQSRGRS